ncbi:FAD-dependent oxidoreductase [Nocardia sp. NBC_00508]|uniref:flavin monoamine oxidase family protein n=1 Tax=Nocardia sp. NBC_00508 TaxID=2975992 RepID=UPI002E812150|nr:FAD-dependent oxidoreductase [Nocardia sp. NBC_00508]WUD68282.1 FAD-dependent oxidoreductase [Nocardia sp. NBC_00508]
MDRADVVVVGAGYAGLCAARAVRAAGREVVVVEAADRVGGRTLTARVGDGWAIDLGGQWISGAHTSFAALAEEYGALTYPPPAGVDLLVEGVVRRRFTGARPPLPTLVLVVLAQAMWRLERMAARVDLARPWTTPGADRLDAMTAATWLRRNLPERRARHLAEVMIGEELCVDVGSISMLGLLTTIRSAGGVEAGITAETVTRLFVEGADGPALAMGVELGRALRLGAAVTSIRQQADGVRVGGEFGEVHAEHVIVAVPPVMAGRISYDPPLPAARDQLTQRMPMGSVLKSFAVYERPFWRDDGLTGQSLNPHDPVPVTFDATRPGGPGVLGALVPGRAAQRLAALPASERRAMIVGSLVRAFGHAARDPIEWHEKVWAEDPYARGGYGAFFPPGVLTTLGSALRQPIGAIHWAGSETATEWSGYIEGAIRSGERAAAEVLALRRSVTGA